MSFIDQLLTGSDDDDENIILDDNRLHSLLNDIEGNERNEDINELISSLEIEDKDRLLFLEIKEEQKEQKEQKREEQKINSSNKIQKQNYSSHIDIVNCFEQQLDNDNDNDNSDLNENERLNIGTSDLEWSLEDSNNNDQENDNTYNNNENSNNNENNNNNSETTTTSQTSEEEELYAYDCQILLDRLNEIDNTFKNTSRDTSVDSSLLVERLKIIQTIGCVQDISLPPGSSPTQLLQPGRRICMLNPKDKAFAYLLRPDVRVEKVLNLIEQILLSIGGLVLHPPPEDTNRYLQFQPLSPSTSSWSSITCNITTNHKKQRALMLIITPSTFSILNSFTTSITSLNGNTSNNIPFFLLSSSYPYSINQIQPPPHTLLSITSTGYTQLFVDTIYEIFSMIAIALHEESMTLYTLHRTINNDGNDKTKQQQQSTFTPLDSLVDPYYIRELYDTYFKELEENVQIMSRSLLESIEQIEKQCARLMTLLRPIYDRCRISLPSPPQKPSEISHFLDPITSLPSSVTIPLPSSFPPSASRSIECTIEMARLIILRARRSYKQLMEQSPSKLNSKDNTSKLIISSKYSSYQQEITLVLKFIYRDIDLTISRYKDIITLHRSQLIHERTLAIDEYKSQLILQLVKRTVSSPEDKQIFNQFIDKFRVITDAEPYLYDVKVCYSVYPIEKISNNNNISSISTSTNSSTNNNVATTTTTNNNNNNNSNNSNNSNNTSIINNSQQQLSITPTGIPIFPSPAGYTTTIQSTNNRNGILYITSSHLYFSSYDIFLLSSIQRVIPIDSISKIGIIRATLIASDAISMVLDLCPTEQIVFYISSPTVYYVDRVIDLILWIKEIRKKETERKLDNSNNNNSNNMNNNSMITSSSPKNLKSISSNEQLLQKQGLQTSTSSQSLSSSSSSPSTIQKKEDNKIEKSISRGDSNELDHKGLQVGDEVKPPSPPVNTSTSGNNKARGIQAYLEKLQKEQQQQQK